MFAICKVVGPNAEDQSWAELTGIARIRAYRTKAAAERRMQEMVPTGKDPHIYAGLEVRSVMDRYDICDVVG